jgi:hypothetical protein
VLRYARVAVGGKALSSAETRISPSAILTLLRQEFGVELLLHEAGPTLFGEFLEGGFVDELFLTLAPHVVGRVANHPRPSLVANIQFLPATAPGGNFPAEKTPGRVQGSQTPGDTLRELAVPDFPEFLIGDPKRWTFFLARLR